MTINCYILFCLNCEDIADDAHYKSAGWKAIEASKVQTTLNLKLNKYEFFALCPDCGKIIENTRNINNF